MCVYNKMNNEDKLFGNKSDIIGEVTEKECKLSEEEFNRFLNGSIRNINLEELLEKNRIYKEITKNINVGEY